jgi:hypothetical protein
LSAVAVLAGSSTALAGFTTGLQAKEYLSGDQQVRDDAFERTAQAGAGIVRISLTWRDVVSQRPIAPANPADPAYDFSSIDAAVTGAAARGLEPMLVVNAAPDFAEGNNAPNDAYGGTWLPDPGDYKNFMTAVATRYSGSFLGLPRVRYYETWNEPNLWVYLEPQWENGEPVVADTYRRLQNAAYDAVHSVDAGNRSIAGSLAPYGDDKGGLRVRPLVFLRRLFCLTDSLKKSKQCQGETRLDLLSHHPINLSGPPRQSAVNPDDASSPDLKNVTKVLRAAERVGTAAGGKRHPVWVSEFWWETKPDGGHQAIPSLKKHARWLEEAMYLYWRQGAKVAIWFLLYDEPFDPQHRGDSVQSGLFFADGRKKPAYTAFRFPFVTERRTRSGPVFAWGRAPVSGKLTIERRSGGKGGWSRVDRINAKAGKVFTAKLKSRGDATFRARVGGETSLAWHQGKAVDKIYEVSSSKVTGKVPTAPVWLRETP